VVVSVLIFIKCFLTLSAFEKFKREKRPKILLYVGSICRACGRSGARVLRPSGKSVNHTCGAMTPFAPTARQREPFYPGQRHHIIRPALWQKRLAKFPFGEAAIFAAIRFAVRQFF
jgi:hypothetical protein